MSQYQAIKAATNAYIKTNGRQEITGAILNAVMIAIIDSLGKFYQFYGNATPDTDPGSIDQNVAFLASTPGTYTKLGGFALAPGEVSVIKYDGTWKKELIVVIPEKVSDLINDLGFITNAVDDLIHYYNKEDIDNIIDSITGQSFVLSWDGTAAPVVADIPAGVVVTYGGTPYTGTLPASADTLGKIYLVKNGADYDQYVTTDNSGYSWILIGSTAIDLSGYATQAEVNQLAFKVGDPADAFQAIPLQMTLGYFDVTGASVASTATSSTQTSYVEIPAKPGDNFKVYGYSPSSPGRLWCFMDASRNVLSIADEDVAARTNPEQLTAPSGAATLLVQFLRYDGSTDKVEKYMPVPISDTLDGTTETDWSSTAQSLTANKYYNTNSSTMPTGTSSSTGTYCAKIAVTPGEIYRITGVGGGASVRLYATAGSDYARKRYSNTNVARRDCPELVTIASDEAYLYVNLYTYDSTTDKIEKLTSASSHEKGLIERVSDLENNPVTTTVVDALNSTSTDDALSANQGRVLNEDINGITSETTEAMTIRDSKYFNTENSRVPSPDNLADTTNGSCVYVYVTPGEVYRIYGKGNSGSWQLYAMADSDRYVVAGGTPGVALNTRATPLDLTIPEGVAILVVNLYQYDSQADKVLKVGHTTTECVKTRLTALEGNDNLEIPLKGKKVMFFGDSVTDLTYNGKGLVSYFQEASLATCYKAAIGGTRFVQRTTPVDNPTTSTQAYAALDICNMVKAWCEADYTKQDAATSYLGDHSARVNALRNNPIGGVDIVCIGGGTNDMTANSPIGNDSDNGFTTIKGSINKMVEMLLTANPKLKIYFYSPVVGYHGAGGRTDANWDDNHQFSSGLTKPEYIDIFTERAKANHIPYINLYWTLGWNQTNFSNYFLDTDDHHPYKGFDVIGRRLYQQVVTNLE